MKKSILIVDDEPSILRLLSVRLKFNNYEIYLAHDGFECIEIAKKIVPDLILMDIKMPNCGGFMAFEQLMLLDKTKHIPVIFMTAYPKSQVNDQVNKMGAIGCISKPFISQDFEKTIELVFN